MLNDIISDQLCQEGTMNFFGEEYTIDITFKINPRPLKVSVLVAYLKIAYQTPTFALLSMQFNF